jgi:translation elongation factor EF-G
MSADFCNKYTDILSADLPKMVKGLKLLSQADPFVEVFQQQTGEWVIVVAGELHLEAIFLPVLSKSDD